MFITQISKSPSWSEAYAISPDSLSSGRDGVLVGVKVGVGAAEIAVVVIVGEIVEVDVAENTVGLIVDGVEISVPVETQPINRTRKITWI